MINETNATPERGLRFLLLAVDHFPPFRVDVSVLFAQEMVQRGHVLDWLLQSEADCEQSYQTRWSGCNVWVGSTDNGETRLARVRKHLRNLRHNLKVFSLTRTEKYDIVQVRDMFMPALFGLLAAKIGGAKFVYWLSYPFPEHSLYEVKQGAARYPIIYFLRGHFWRFLLYRIIIPNADHVFVQSEQMKRDIIAEGAPPDKVSPVPMGIKLDSFSKYSGTVDLPPDHVPRIVYLGTLIKIRRMDFLIRAMSHVLMEIPDAELWFVGSGDGPGDEQWLRDEAQRLGISKQVIFTGFLPQDQALRHVLEADVCVSPFLPTPVLNSTSPTKLIEYMAMGKAVVANDHPEQRLVIEESGGGLCVPYEEKAFAAAIVTILRDPQGAALMGQRGRDYVSRYRTYAHIADVVEKTYLELSAATR